MTKRSTAEHRGDALNQLKEFGRCSIPNAAVLMGVHHHTLRNYVESGEVEAFWLGTRPWVTKDEIERYQREGKRTNPMAPLNVEANWGGSVDLTEDTFTSF